MQKAVERLVDRILAAKQRDAGADVSALERELDELAYALCALTPEEIKLVGGQSPAGTSGERSAIESFPEARHQSRRDAAGQGPVVLSHAVFREPVKIKFPMAACKQPSSLPKATAKKVAASLKQPENLPPLKVLAVLRRDIKHDFLQASPAAHASQALAPREVILSSWLVQPDKG